MSSTASNPETSPSTRPTISKIRKLDGVRILATGSCVPQNAVRNEDLAALGYDADWILQRTGIRQRFHAPPGVATSDLAYEAARRCIEPLELQADEIDLLIVATMTPDSPVPSAACVVQERLGIHAASMDINAACAGFMYALITGMQFVQTGTSQLVLVIGADINSRIVNPADRKTFPLFGDGAGAVLLGSRLESNISTTFTLGADGCGKDLLHVPAGGSRVPITHDVLISEQQYLQMDGRSVFKWAVRMLTESIQNVLDHAGMSLADLDLVVLHQANIRIIEAAADALGIDRSKLVINLDRYGNTSAASIPLALDEAVREGRLREGHRVLLCGFGAGLTWGTALIQW